MIKAAFIDIDNTLLDFNESSKIAIARAFTGNGLEYNEKIFPVFKKVNDALWSDVEKKIIDKPYLHEVRFNRVLERLGSGYAGKAEGKNVEKLYLAALHETAVKIDGAAEICDYLSKKYLLCAASNAYYDQQINRLKKAGLLDYFAHIFVSEKIGVNKPDEGFFKACFNALGKVLPSEAVMIGDSVTADIIGAKKYGMQTVWFLPVGAENCAYADFKVKTLSEIKNYL